MTKVVILFVTVLATTMILFYDQFSMEIGQPSELIHRIRMLVQTEPEKHKDLFPMNSRDYWGTFLVAVGTMIAASGGIGGGGILVPLLILVYDFHPKYAIPLSNFTILGSSITNMILNFSKRHPDADRPLVDWDLILVMEPLTMAGAVRLAIRKSALLSVFLIHLSLFSHVRFYKVVGAFISKVLPDWLLVVSLVILLAYTTYTTVDKGISQWKKETKRFEDAKKSVLVKTIESEIEMSESTGLLAEEGAEKYGKK